MQQCRIKPHDSWHSWDHTGPCKLHTGIAIQVLERTVIATWPLIFKHFMGSYWFIDVHCLLLCFLLCCACVINLFKEKQLQLGHWDNAPTIVWKVGGSLISCGGKSFPEGRYLKSWSVHLNAMRLSVPGSVLYNRAPWLEGVNHVRLGLLCIVTCWSRHFMTSIGFPLPLPVFSRAIHEL